MCANEQAENQKPAAKFPLLLKRVDIALRHELLQGAGSFYFNITKIPRERETLYFH